MIPRIAILEKWACRWLHIEKQDFVAKEETFALS